MDEILEKLKNHPDFSFLWSEHNPMLSLPGLEIDQMQRKVYCNSQEIKLTTKEYDLLCLLTAIKGRVLTYDQIYQKIWKEWFFQTIYFPHGDILWWIDWDDVPRSSAHLSTLETVLREHGTDKQIVRCSAWFTGPRACPCISSLPDFPQISPPREK